MISSSPAGPAKVISLPRTCVSTSGNCRSMVRSSSSRGPSRVDHLDRRRDLPGQHGGVAAALGACGGRGAVRAVGLGWSRLRVIHRGARVYVSRPELLTTNSARSLLCWRRDGSWTYIMWPGLVVGVLDVRERSAGSCRWATTSSAAKCGVAPS